MAQKNEWVNQVIVVNGGKFEVTPPYADYVTVEAYHPATHMVDVFDVIHTQSVQDVIVKGNFAYVAAQDSIVMYNIDTYQRVAAVPDSGLNKLCLFNDRLIVTKQYPIKRFFAEVLDASNLALIARIQNISGDCGGVVIAADTAYIAVDSGYLGTHGKLAVINTTNWTLNREVDFGTSAIGIHDLYNYGGSIYCLNKTPYGGQDSSSITKYNSFTSTFTTKLLGVALGNGVGLLNNILYAQINNGIGTYNLETQQIVNPAVIPDPGVANHLFIVKGAVNYVDNQLYVNMGNEATFGVGIVTTAAGDSVTSFPEGVNAEAMAVDYRTPVGISNVTASSSVILYPNPVNDFLNIRMNDNSEITSVTISEMSGRTIYSMVCNSNERSLRISCSDFAPGIYLLSITNGSGVITRKFVKN